MSRTCTDNNNCGTNNDKPIIIDTCVYGGSCSDGLMNGDEGGIDCGGSCDKVCEILTEEEKPSIEITADTIEGDILSNYNFPVSIKNIGDIQAEDIKLAVNKWNSQPKTIELLVSGETRDHTFTLNLPAKPENQLDVQVFYKDVPIETKSIPVNLLVPKHAIKFIKDPETGKLYPVIIIDNRNTHRRKMDVQYTLEKDGESYVLDALDGLVIIENEVFHKTESVPLKNLPEGDYNLVAEFREQGEIVGEQNEIIEISGDTRSFNARSLFYSAIVIIVGLFAYIIFIYKPKQRWS